MIKPKVIKPIFTHMPDALKNFNHWVVWKFVLQKGKWNKLPFQISGRMAKINDPSTWSSFDTVKKKYKSGEFDGIGFVFNKDNPFLGIDLDEKDKKLEKEIKKFGSYVERSVSGRGLHAIVKVKKRKLPDYRKRKGPLEAYQSGRYFIMTGDRLTDKDIIYCHKKVCSFLNKYLLNNGSSKNKPSLTERISPSIISSNDHNLIKQIVNSDQGLKFFKLWSGDRSGYMSPSEADQALAFILGTWTKGDQERTIELFSQSALGHRKKWQDRDDYRKRTIKKAIESIDPVELALQNNEDIMIGAKEFLEMEFQPLEWAIDGVIRKRSFVLLAGPAKSFKSYFVIQMAVSMLGGKEFCEIETNKAKKIIYIQYELSPRSLQNRIASIAKALGVDQKNIDRSHFCLITRRPGFWILPKIDDPEWMSTINEILKKDRPDWLIIDPLKKAINCDENSNNEMGKVCDYLIDLRDRYECGVLVVHHCGKIGQDKKPSPKNIRGASILVDACDSLLQVHRPKLEDKKFILSTTAHRDGGEIDPIEIELRTDKGYALYPTGIRPVLRSEIKKTDSDIKNEFIGILINNGGEATIDEIEREGISKCMRPKIGDQLMKEGKIIITGGKKGDPKIYKLSINSSNK